MGHRSGGLVLRMKSLYDGNGVFNSKHISFVANWLRNGLHVDLSVMSSQDLIIKFTVKEIGHKPFIRLNPALFLN